MIAVPLLAELPDSVDCNTDGSGTQSMDTFIMPDDTEDSDLDDERGMQNSVRSLLQSLLFDAYDIYSYIQYIYCSFG